MRTTGIDGKNVLEIMYPRNRKKFGRQHNILSTNIHGSTTTLSGYGVHLSSSVAISRVPCQYNDLPITYCSLHAFFLLLLVIVTPRYPLHHAVPGRVQRQAGKDALSLDTTRLEQICFKSRALPRWGYVQYRALLDMKCYGERIDPLR
jgi:hypothetical protein